MAASSQEEDGMISGINITPMVDITLVLLIIFMVTAKIIVSQSMPLDLPKAASGQQIQTIFSIQLRSNGETNVDSKKVPADESVLALAREAKAKNDDLRAVIQADQTVTHGRVIHVLDLLKQAGVAKIAFGVTPIESDKAPAPAGSN
ncbi:MAG TPA: biopolymer transporter ExbD [Polyangiaceae bacterium]|nr:biopolymer transporter ExbD [Polyangiaceae bacterium]